jgi:hypothetical protein
VHESSSDDLTDFDTAEDENSDGVRSDETLTRHITEADGTLVDRGCESGGNSPRKSGTNAKDTVDLLFFHFHMTAMTAKHQLLHHPAIQHSLMAEAINSSQSQVLFERASGLGIQFYEWPCWVKKEFMAMYVEKCLLRGATGAARVGKAVDLGALNLLDSRESLQALARRSAEKPAEQLTWEARVGASTPRSAERAGETPDDDFDPDAALSPALAKSPLRLRRRARG